MNNASRNELPDEATIAAYLSNRLDGVRTEAFEAYCLRHPDFAEQVEMDLYLKEGLRQLKSPDNVRQAAHRRRTLLAIAASLVLIVGGGLLLLPHAHIGALVAYRSATDVPAQLLAGPRVSATLIRLRGSGSAIRRVVAPPDAGVLRVRISPDSSAGPLGYAVTVALEPRVIPRSVRLDNLHADADGYIEMYLPLADLSGHTMRVTVSPSPATGEYPLSFRLQIENPSKAVPGIQ